MTKRQELKAFIMKLAVDRGIHPFMINCGGCEDFALEIQEEFPAIQVFWGDELPDLFPKQLTKSENHSAHCFIRFEGNYYDAEEPEGVPKPYQLPLYQRMLFA